MLCAIFWGVRRRARIECVEYTSLAIVLTCPATFVLLFFPDWLTVLEIWKPRMVISVQCGMSIMLTVVFQEPAAIALDFRMFKHAPVAFSYRRSVPANAGMPFGSVTSRVMSSAYATTVVRVPLPILIHVSVRSKSHSRGFRHKANSNILNGQPCRTPHCIGIGHVVCPLMWIEEYAWSYMFFMRAMNLVLKPYTASSLNR